MSAPERIWVQWPHVNGAGLAFSCQARPPASRTEYVRADRIEALIAERDRQYDENVHRIAEQARVEAERDAARDAALEEAAKVASARKGNGWEDAPAVHPYDKGYIAACDAVAAAIRTMKGNSHE